METPLRSKILEPMPCSNDMESWLKARPRACAIIDWFGDRMMSRLEKIPTHGLEFDNPSIKIKAAAMKDFVLAMPFFIGLVGTIGSQYFIWKVIYGSGYSVRLGFVIILAISWVISLIIKLFA